MTDAQVLIKVARWLLRSMNIARLVFFSDTESPEHMLLSLEGNEHPANIFFIFFVQVYLVFKSLDLSDILGSDC